MSLSVSFCFHWQRECPKNSLSDKTCDTARKEDWDTARISFAARSCEAFLAAAIFQK